jgi:hypothetical protein
MRSSIVLGLLVGLFSTPLLANAQENPSRLELYGG